VQPLRRRDHLGDIEVPALAIVGEHDTLTPTGYHEYLADEIPEGDLEVVDDAAHLAMLERPGAFNDAIAAFVGRVGQN
jgi:pimeloyl-ACP methyl ester carboxylesterase